MTRHHRAPGPTRTARHGAPAAQPGVRGTAVERARQRLSEGLTHEPLAGLSRPLRLTTGGRILSVRVSREEARAFDVVIGAAGFPSRSAALRTLVCGAGGAVAPLPQEVELLAGIGRELHRIGVNVNQVALASNRRQIALMRAEWQVIGQLRTLLPELRLAIGQLIGRRRQAGLLASGTTGAGEGAGTGKGAAHA